MRALEFKVECVGVGSEQFISELDLAQLYFNLNTKPSRFWGEGFWVHKSGLRKLQKFYGQPDPTINAP